MTRHLHRVRPALLAVALLVVPLIARADDDDHGPPLDPAVFGPAVKLIAAIVLLAVAGFVWYNFRLRAIRRASRESPKSDGRRYTD